MSRGEVGGVVAMMAVATVVYDGPEEDVGISITRWMFDVIDGRADG